MKQIKKATYREDDEDEYANVDTENYQKSSQYLQKQHYLGN